MGGATADGPISWRMSSLFLFNIVVGTGVLSLPHIFATAGLLLSSAFLIITAGLSYVCVSWQTEAMAILAAIEHLDNSPVRVSRITSHRCWDCFVSHLGRCLGGRSLRAALAHVRRVMTVACGALHLHAPSVSACA